MVKRTICKTTGRVSVPLGFSSNGYFVYKVWRASLEKLWGIHDYLCAIHFREAFRPLALTAAGLCWGGTCLV